MRDERCWFERFIEDFGKVPERDRPPLIPKELRVPVFAVTVLVSLVLLLVFLWLVVLPAIRSQKQPPRSESPIRLCDSSRLIY